jgi:hypothetical protein
MVHGVLRCPDPLRPPLPQVLINSSFYAQHLPRSLAGIIYFDDVAMADKIQATRIYVQMLDHYPHLHEGSIPLLQINRKALIAANAAQAGGGGTTDAVAHGVPEDAEDPEESMLIIDRSMGARAFLMKHNMENYKANHPYQKFPKRFRFSKQRQGIAEEAENAEVEREARRRDRVVRKGGYPADTDTCHTLSAPRVSSEWCAQTCGDFFCPPELCSEACFITKMPDALGMARAEETSPYTNPYGLAPAQGIHIPMSDAAAAQRAARAQMQVPHESKELLTWDDDNPTMPAAYEAAAADVPSAKSEAEAKAKAIQAAADAEPEVDAKRRLMRRMQVRRGGAEDASAAGPLPSGAATAQPTIRCHAIADGAGIDDAWCQSICTENYCPEKMCSKECVEEALDGLLPIPIEVEDPEDKIRREYEEARTAAESAYPSAASAASAGQQQQQQENDDPIGGGPDVAPPAAEDEAPHADETPVERMMREAKEERAAAEEANRKNTAAAATENAAAEAELAEEKAKAQAEADEEAAEKEAAGIAAAEEAAAEVAARIPALPEPVPVSPTDQATSAAEAAKDAAAAAAKAMADRADEARAAMEEGNNAAASDVVADNAVASATADKAAVSTANAEAAEGALAAAGCMSVASAPLQAHGITNAWCIKTCSNPDQCPLNVCSADCKYKKIVVPEPPSEPPADPKYFPAADDAAAEAARVDAANKPAAAVPVPAASAGGRTGGNMKAPANATDCTLGNASIVACASIGCRSMAEPKLIASGVDDRWCIATCQVGGCPYDVCSHECMLLSPEEDPDLGGGVAQVTQGVKDGTITTDSEFTLPKMDPNHTYQNGWTLGRLTALFKYGEPTNNLSHAGFTFHGFDGTEDERRPWVPCTSSWCQPTPVCKFVNITHDKRTWPPNEPAYKNWTYYSHMIKRYGNKRWKNCTWRDAVWMSASILNAKQHHSISSSGILFTPAKTKVLCSWPDDMSSLDKGCATDFTAQRPAHPMPFLPLELKEMLTISMNPQNMATSLYNEVLIDANNYKDNLPHSIAAVVYFDDSAVADKVVAVHTYLQILDEYNLTRAQLPLLKVARARALSAIAAGELVVDESAGASAYIEHHSFEKFRKNLAPTVHKFADGTSIEVEPSRLTIPGGSVSGGNDSACTTLDPGRVSAEWCTVNCLYSQMATAEADKAEARDLRRGEKNGARRKDSAAVDCPPEYCSCPGDGIDHPSPGGEQKDPMQDIFNKAASDPFHKDRADWLDNPVAVPIPELDNPREDAFEQFRRTLFPRERHATERADDLVNDPFEALRRVARDPFESFEEALRRVPK